MMIQTMSTKCSSAIARHRCVFLIELDHGAAPAEPDERRDGGGACHERGGMAPGTHPASPSMISSMPGTKYEEGDPAATQIEKNRWSRFLSRPPPAPVGRCDVHNAEPAPRWRRGAVGAGRVKKVEPKMLFERSSSAPCSPQGVNSKDLAAEGKMHQRTSAEQHGARLLDVARLDRVHGKAPWRSGDMSRRTSRRT